MSLHPLALTSLQAIKDAEVRAAFQSLVDFFAANDFVTRDDVVGTTSASAASANRAGLAPANTGSPVSVWNRPPRPGEVSSIIGQLENQIRESALFRKLGERIDLIDKPTTGIVFRLGKAEGTIGAQGAALTGVEVAIASERDARISADNAVLQVTNTQYAQVNQSIALVQGQVTTISNNYSSLAATTSTLQSTIGQISNDINNPGTGLKVSLQQEAQTRATNDGKMYSQWTVRIDMNGRVAGFGMDATGTRTSMNSMALFRVDTFAVAGTTAPDSATTKPTRGANESDASYQARIDAWGDAISAAARAEVDAAINRSEDVPGVVSVPFIVKTQYWRDDGGVEQPPGVYMRRAMVQKFVADTAYIRTAAVTALKIRGESVTIPTFASAFSSIYIDAGSANTYTEVLSCDVDYLPVDATDFAPSEVAIMAVCGFYAASNGGDSSLRMRIYRNGILQDEQGVSAAGGFTAHLSTVVRDTPGEGIHRYTMEVSVEQVGPSPTTYRIANRSLLVLGVKR